MKSQSTSLADVLARFEHDEEFKKADRKIAPYYDLVIQIIHRRNELKLTQKDLAEKANTHQSRISKIESAEHDIRLSTLIEIAEALDTEVKIRLVPIERPILVASDERSRNFFGVSAGAEQSTVKFQKGGGVLYNFPSASTTIEPTVTFELAH